MLKSHPGLHGHLDTFGLARISLTPPLIGANATVTQVYAAPVVEVGDYVWATTIGSFSGACLIGAFVVNPGEIELTWLNTDNQSVTPPATNALLFFLRGPVHDVTVAPPIQPGMLPAGGG